MTDRDRLEQQLDEKIRDICRTRDQLCITCLIRLTPINRTVGHFMKRRHIGTRWSVLNCWGQCADCNIQDDTERFRKVLENRLDNHSVQTIITAAHSVTKYSLSDLREILSELKSYEKQICREKE
jgi:hypothetical protein